jgi:hypothetical protein
MAALIERLNENMRYGSTLALSQIWTLGGYSGRELTAAAREQELRRKIKAADKTIVVLSE